MVHDLSTQKGRNIYVEAISKPNKYIVKVKPLVYWGLDKWGNEIWK